MPMLLALIALSSLVPAVAETLPPKPLPGNTPCAYPAEALRSQVAGPVLFTAQVEPDGSVTQVDVRQMPATALGFEDALRGCVSKWRFEPAASERGLRQYAGKIHYHVAVAEEVAVRALLETFASAWNANDSEAIAGLQPRTQQAEGPSLGSTPSLSEQFSQERVAANWNMELEPDVELIRFLRTDLATVRQPFHRRNSGGTASSAHGDLGLLEATAIKRGDWWTLLGWYPIAGSPSSRQWIVPGIEEPRRLMHPLPAYPDLGLHARVSARVILGVQVDTEGKISFVNTLHGHPIFDEAAIEAVKRWEYAPTLLQGAPIPVVRRVSIDFSLDEAHGQVVAGQGIAVFVPAGRVRVLEDIAVRLLAPPSPAQP